MPSYDGHSRPPHRDKDLLDQLVAELEEDGRHWFADRLRIIRDDLEALRDQRLIQERDTMALRCVMDGKWGMLFGRFVEMSAPITDIGPPIRFSEVEFQETS